MSFGKRGTPKQQAVQKIVPHGAPDVDRGPGVIALTRMFFRDFKWPILGALMLLFLAVPYASYILRLHAMEERAKDLLREQLIDPESARFRNVTVDLRTGKVVGEVNSKNHLGGYVGFQCFFVSGNGASIGPHWC